MYEAHGLCQPLLTLLQLTIRCIDHNASINVCLENYDSRQIADLTHNKQFPRAVFTIKKFPIEIDVRFFFVL